MSFGRALRKIPSRASSRVYHARPGDRRAAASRSAPRCVRATPDDPGRLRVVDAERREAVRMPTMTAGSDPDERLEPAADRVGRSSCGRSTATDARGRVVDPGDDVEERGLARAVRPDQADDRAARDVEADVVDRDQAAEPLGDVLARIEQRCRPPVTWRSSVERRSRRASWLADQGHLAEVVGGMELPLASSGREEALGSEQHHQRPGRCRRAGTGTGRS